MKYIGIGRILPERTDVNFSTFVGKMEGGGQISITCEASQVTVVIETDQELGGYVSAFLLASDTARSAVAALGFSLGSGYDVEIISIIEESGENHVFGVRPGNLHFEPHLPVFTASVQAAGKDLFFRYALHDYVSALKHSRDCAFLCYRAIEAIKSAFDLDGKGWSAMHSALGTNQIEITSTVKQFADVVRHGNWAATKETTSIQRNAMLTLTKSILLRYLIQKHGFKAHM